MKRVNTFTRLCVALLLMVMMAGVSSITSSAHDPTATLRNVYGAPRAVLTLYQVKPNMEPQFLDAMVKSGPYNRLLSGFANERILQPLSASNEKGLTYTCVDRYYDLGTADFVESQRLAAVKPFLVHDPVRMDATLVEHLLADWGWEHGTKQNIIRAEPFKNDEIFQKNISSLSFFKGGYTGQVGMLEVFPEGTTVEQVRAQIVSHEGLSGASIFSWGKGRYACYCEFFKSPTGVDHHHFKVSMKSEAVTGGQAGVVVQNYLPR